VSQGYLPTLHENEELELSDVATSGATRDDFVPPGGTAPASGASTHGRGAAAGVAVMPLSLKVGVEGWMDDSLG
jgi:hypothetical protein